MTRASLRLLASAAFRAGDLDIARAYRAQIAELDAAELLAAVSS